MTETIFLKSTDNIHENILYNRNMQGELPIMGLRQYRGPVNEQPRYHL